MMPSESSEAFGSDYLPEVLRLVVTLSPGKSFCVAGVFSPLSDPPVIPPAFLKLLKPRGYPNHLREWGFHSVPKL